ncbi:MAG: protein-export chaperone SecB [Alphaproteobacteria bacterium]
MTDNATPAEGAAEQGNQASMLPISVVAQYVKDLSFENPNAPRSLMPSDGQPKLDMNVDVAVNLIEGTEDQFEVVLNITGKASTGDMVGFVVELAYAGVVQLHNVPAEHVNPLVMIQGPHMLFPYARNVISEVTRDGGFAPLMLNPIDFAALYQQRVAQQQQDAGGVQQVNPAEVETTH